MPTVAIELVSGQTRDPGSNVPTLVVQVWRDGASFEELFVRHYPVFASACREVDEPGLAVVAIDLRRDRVDGILRLAARPERVATGIVGRHSHADLLLEGSAGLALRHLAILMEPARDWRRGSTDIGYRVLDLRTGTGFESETGEPLVGVRCEGSAMFRCASYALLCLATGDPSDWPAAARDAWSSVPERVFFDERHAFRCPDPRSLAAGAGPSMGQVTTVVETLGPRLIADAAPTSDPPQGSLELTTGGSGHVFPVGSQALTEGLLLGRYDRCQGAELLLGDCEVSRVHALVIQLRDRLVAVDTASTNGVFVDGAPVRSVELDDGMTLTLGRSGRVRVRWRTPPGSPQQRRSLTPSAGSARPPSRGGRRRRRAPGGRG